MSALFKDFFRGMLKNKGKFISVFFIILLGAAFFSGLRSSKNDMLLSAERYYDDNSLYDITVAGTLGLTDDDLADITALDGVAYAEGAYSLDVLLTGDAMRTVKLISLSSYINAPTLTQGRLPQNDGECVLDSLLLELGAFNIGDTITFESGDGSNISSQLARTQYTIVGFADLPQYMDLNRGTGTVGNGEIDGFVLLAPEAFTLSYYTQINVLVEGAKAADSFESDYDVLVSSAQTQIEGIAEQACQRRYDQILDYINEEILPSFPPQIQIPPGLIESLIPSPEWYVLDRSSSVLSYVNYQNDAERIASLGELLPIVFFLVAALVSLTAMTRLVEEERQQIGTLKALGSSNGAILLRYLMYALLPTLLGSVAGVLIGEKVFPLAILNTYGLLYTGLKSFVLPYNLVEGAIAVAASVLSTGIATIAACYKISRELPAQIMRPEAPKPGKRVLLERVPFIWNRLGFTQKSTVRNLFRNKKRFLMTIIGVAGCMGLLLVGLGLHDSIMVVADMQFTKLTHYQASVTVQEGMTEDEMNSFADEIIAENGDGVNALIIYQKSVDAQTDGGMQTVTLSVPQTTDGIESYFTFRQRLGHGVLSIPEDGALISEKTAATLGVSAGDTVTVRDGTNSVSVTISAVYENYIGHYIFISQDYYNQLFGGAPPYNQILLTYPDGSEQFQSTLGEMLLADQNVQGVTFISTLVDWADDTLSSLNTIVLIVLAAAALLAIVVLYNLNSINIAERKRELSTLKVLGFYDSEVASYVYRENILLTIIGILIGIGLGVLLHGYVITSIEVDMIMFGRSIFWYSYLLGALMTFAFSVIINLVMYRSLKKIDMIESLKSIE